MDAKELMGEIAAEPSINKLIHRELNQSPVDKAKDYFTNLATLLRRERALIAEQKAAKEAEKEANDDDSGT